MRLQDIQCYLLDMDGTIYLGNELLPGAKAFLELLEKENKNYLFLTNNSSKNRLAYQKKLESLGCQVNLDQIFTSGEATTIYMNQLKPGAKIFLLGTKNLEEEFNNAGFHLTNDTDEEPEYVVLGFDTTLNYDKLWKACDYIREGITYIATHPDFNCPLEEGKFMPDTGAMIEFIAASTGKRPHVVGKPNKDIIQAICDKYGYKKDALAMVGDRLYTDIKTGENAGITSILVLTGETSMEEYNQSDIQADYIFSSVKELGEQLAAQSNE